MKTTIPLPSTIMTSDHQSDAVGKRSDKQTALRTDVSKGEKSETVDRKEHEKGKDC